VPRRNQEHTGADERRPVQHDKQIIEGERRAQRRWIAQQQARVDAARMHGLQRILPDTAHQEEHEHGQHDRARRPGRGPHDLFE